MLHLEDLGALREGPVDRLVVGTGTVRRRGEAALVRAPRTGDPHIAAILPAPRGGSRTAGGGDGDKGPLRPARRLASLEVGVSGMASGERQPAEQDLAGPTTRIVVALGRPAQGPGARRVESPDRVLRMWDMLNEAAGEGANVAAPP